VRALTLAPIRTLSGPASSGPMHDEIRPDVSGAAI
jgi:hypothetical protein